MRAINLDRSSTLADSLEVAASLWSRFLGLMGRRALPAGLGLWLTGTNGIHMFFMRFAIDAVFLGKPDDAGGRRVLATRRSLRPWVGIVPLIRGADGVLELPEGTIDATGTLIGDRVQFE